jgi:hypothetical protein
VPPPAGVGVCDSAGLPRLQSISAVEAANAGFDNTDIIPILIRRRRSVVIDKFGKKRLPSIRDEPISIYPGGPPRITRRFPTASSINRCQERGGARGWKATRAELRWTNPASVISYKNSTACGSSNGGGVANNTVPAIAITAQIAQPS